MASTLNVTTAFAAGLISFASPCVLPLIPAYLSFITGSSLEELRSKALGARLRVFSHAVMFCIGFSIVFVAAGLAAGSIGSSLTHDRVWLARIGGVVTIILGLQMTGIIKISQLMGDRRLQLGRSGQRSLFASLLVGIGFAAGWSPCIGPILASILFLAASERSLQATILLSAYSLGLALPFLITALAVEGALSLLKRLGSIVRYIEIGAGVLLIVLGWILFSGGLTRLSGVFPSPLGHF